MAQQSVLDWKLDITNPTYAREYNVQHQKFVTLEARAFYLLLASVAPAMVILGKTLYNLDFLDFEVWCSVYMYAPCCVVMCILTFWKPVQQNAALIAGVAFGCIPLTFVISDWVYPNHWMYSEFNSQLDSVGFLTIIALHIWNFSAVLTAFAIISVQVIATLVVKRTEPWQVQLGLIIPHYATYVLCLYCGYYMERRMKLDFLRLKLMDFEAQKLKWIVARDASLLRNIFPKNLSDELEQQISLRRQSTIPATPFFPPSTSTASFSRIFTNFNTPKRTTSFANSHIEPVRTKSLLQQESETPEEIELAPTADTSLQSRSPRKQFTSLSVVIPHQVDVVDHRGEQSPVFSIPPIIYTPALSTNSTSSGSSSETSTGVPRLSPSVRFLTSSGKPLNTGHGPELHTFLNGAQHSDGSLIALSHSYPNVVVIFADIAGFTNLSSSISPQELVQLLNKLFSMFDDIMDQHNLEKIRTVGDAYLCVGNMSLPLEHPEEQAVVAALKMISAVASIQEKDLRLRVGIASGPLIAGVTGITKWNYDIFGKPFADATLMETSSQPNCVSVTNLVYQYCKQNPIFKFQQANVQNADSEFVTERYVIDTNEDPSAIEPYVATHSGASMPEQEREHNTGLEILTQPNQLVQLGLELPAQQILDLIPSSSPDLDNLDSSSEPSAAPLSPKSTFDFSLEDLDKENIFNVSLFKRMLNSFMKFNNPVFEAEYWSWMTEKVYSCTTNFLALLIFITVVMVITDVCMSGAESMPLGVWVTYGVQFFLLIAMIIFRRLQRQRAYSFYVSTLIIFWYNSNIVLMSFFFPTSAHFYWVIMTMCIFFSFVELQGITIIFIEFISAIVSGTSAFVMHPKVLRYPVMYFSAVNLCVFVTIVCQYYLVRSFRMEFLALKRLKFDTAQQKVVQHRAKMLLSNILPDEIIPRLQPAAETGGVTYVVDLFQDATMMFINTTNLEELTSTLDAASAFHVYNEVFTLFDEATRSFGLEKIKTINTVYMVACGVPKKIENHAEQAIRLAREIYHIARQYSFPLLKGKLKVRIGIASGPVVAGIIGKKKYAYDCWSDTTNVASRMESNGWHGYAQVSPSVYALVHGKFDFQKRENVFIKGKGNMDTFILKLS